MNRNRTAAVNAPLPRVGRPVARLAPRGRGSAVSVGAVGACFAVSGALLCAALLGGCPLRVDPPGPADCAQRTTCEQCGSQPDCAWCVREGEHHCFAEGELPTCELEVHVSDECPADARSELVPATSGN